MIRKSPQGTGSDTRMYNPRSESEEFMYGDDEESYGPGDPENRELESQKKKEEREEQQRKWAGLNHLKLRTAKPAQEEPFEESTPMEQQTELSDLTGPAGSRGEDLDQAVGARTGTGSALGELPPQLPAMGAFGMTRSHPDDYAMELAWTNIRKVLGDPKGTTTLESTDRAMRSRIGSGGTKPRSAHRIKAFPRPIGGRSPWASTKRRASVHQRLFGNIKGTGGKSIRGKSKTGMMRQPYTLSPHHLGVGSLWGKPRPGRLEDPGKYLSWLSRQSAYRGAGGSGVMLPYTPHASREQLGQLKYPGSQGSGHMRLLPGQSRLAREGPRRATRGPPKPKGMRGGIPSPLASPATASPLASMFAKADLEELVDLSKAYVQIVHSKHKKGDKDQTMKDMLEQVKDLLDKLSLKSLMGIAGGGNRSEGMIEAPANGPQKTSRNEGATETDPEDDPRYWGADPSQLTRRGGVHHA